MNNILMTDSYKASHFKQYPPGTKNVYSYIESRGIDTDASFYSEEDVDEKMIFFGLQAFLMRYLDNPVTWRDVDEAEAVFTPHGVPFNRQGWDYVRNSLNGKIPLKIMAVPEGSVLPLRIPLVGSVNTDTNVAWMTSYFETSLLRAVWYGSTVATNSWRIKQDIRRYLDATADNTDLQIGFKLHDFGARGVSSSESAGIGGTAHTINFFGTDNIEALMFAKKWYGEPMSGFSIPASEHSTMTSWGRDQEEDAYRNMLTQFGGLGKTLAVVSDSYDIYNAVDNLWGGKLKDEVINNGATVVVRPDSGDPVEVVRKVTQKLMNKFGYTTNTKGYEVLPPYIRVIQGDGVSRKSINAILLDLKKNKISAENIAFGMGGALLQDISRDSLKFAMKASAAKVGTRWRDVYKETVTDKTKASKRGLVDTTVDKKVVVRDNIKDVGKGDSLMNTVFYRGNFVHSSRQTLGDIRARSNAG
jgi:nicotinamide phosphoribosyltransferase